MSLEKCMKGQPPGSEWVLLQAYQALLNEEKEMKEKEEARLRKLKFRQSLDEHIKLANQLRRGENDDDMEYYQRISKDVERFRQEEGMAHKAVKMKHNEELKWRIQQIKERIDREAAEKQSLMDFEKESLRINSIKMEQDAEAARNAKQREYERMKKIEAFNTEERKVKERLKLELQEEDRRLMEEYEKKLDKEAFERGTEMYIFRHAQMRWNL
jgi:hypothetical protein